MIIPGVLDQGATTEHRPVLFFLDERRWMEGSLFIACSAPQASLRRHAAGGLHRATALKKPILKQSQSQTLTLETGTRIPTPGSTFYSAILFYFFTLTPTRGRKVWCVKASSQESPAWNLLTHVRVGDQNPGMLLQRHLHAFGKDTVNLLSKTAAIQSKM